MAFSVKFKGEDLGVFDVNEITMDEALQLEDTTGMTVDEMVKALAKSSARGAQAVIWFQQLRRGNHTELHQNFRFGDYDIEAVAATDPTNAPVIELPGAAAASPSGSGARAGSRTSRTTSA